MAPWAAVAPVQGTVYRSVHTALQLFLMITAGTLLAAGAALLTDNTMTAMIIALPIAVLLGNWAPIDGQGLYAPSTALFVLAYGSYSLVPVGHRLLETAVGAAVGIAVNAFVLPPVPARQPAGVRAAARLRALTAAAERRHCRRLGRVSRRSSGIPGRKLLWAG
ncbi:FUSC family protein [Streptomyces sp. CA-256286]|uniref:FUSC family protein n=1 Tax=Streptomyces sp. CA-256286 TaxID=2801033 RepID=UPI001F614D4D|nr:FUSC family protein [Streptomyces sp. CA-256286]